MDGKAPKSPKPAKTNRVRKAKDHVAVLEPELVAEIDAVVLELATPWYRARRSDALRLLLLKGLAAHKAEEAAKPA